MVHVYRAAGGDSDHRRPDRPLAADGPEGPRGRTPEVPEQPQADRAGDPQLPQPSTITATAAEGNYELFVPQERKAGPLGWYKAVVVAYGNPRPGNRKSLIDRNSSDEKTTP
jgi:hypothetical protein